jgi:glycerophosphoryl diester phosphodiesterase
VESRAQEEAGRLRRRRFTRVPGWLCERPIAHRGLHDETRPENSLSAFEAAAQAGYPIELDVHATRDGRVVVFHDDDLERMTGVSGRVAGRTLAEIAELRLHGTAERIPSLDEVLHAIGGRVPILVDLKNEGRPGRLEHAVAHAVRGYSGQIAIQSFNPLTLAWFRLAAPAIARGLLACDFVDTSLPRYKKFLLRRLLLAPLSGPHYIGYDLHSLPHWAPRLARHLGVPLLAWTIRTDDELRRATELADNVIFERVRP